jgi:type I restriction enzyme S subunit
MEKQMNRPKLRFPEFKGEWERKKLGEVVSNKSGKYNPDKETESVKCIELEHLASESSQLLGYIDGKNSGSIKNKFDKGDVLFGKLRPYLKKYLLAPFDGVCSSEIWVLKGQNISNDFLFRIIQTESFIDLANQSSGSKMPRADWSVVESGIFSFPSLPEQKRIASFLTALDQKNAELKQKKNLLEQYKKGVMQKLFSQALRFKDENGKEFPKWEKKRLGEIARITTGSSNRQDSNLDGDYTFFDRSQDIRTSDRFLFDAEAIIVPGEGQEFIPKYFKGKFDLHQRTYAIMDFKGIDGMFLFYSISFNSNHLNSHAVGSTVKSLRLPMFLTMPINLPCLKEQTKIANFLSAIDEKINRTENQLQQTQAYKKGLLQKMFV